MTWVRVRFEALQRGVLAVPAEHQRGRQVGADQEERVVAGQCPVVLVHRPEGGLALGGGAERELAAGAAGAGRGLRAAGVQDAGDARDLRVDRQPGAAGLLVTPADQRRSRPVPGRRLPRAARELVTEAEEQQRHRLGGRETDHYGAHAPTITLARRPHDQRGTGHPVRHRLEVRPGGRRAAACPGSTTAVSAPVTLPHTVVPLSWQDWDPADWERVWVYRKHFDALARARSIDGCSSTSARP